MLSAEGRLGVLGCSKMVQDGRSVRWSGSAFVFEGLTTHFAPTFVRMTFGRDEAHFRRCWFMAPGPCLIKIDSDG